MTAGLYQRLASTGRVRNLLTNALVEEGTGGGEGPEDTVPTVTLDPVTETSTTGASVTWTSERAVSLVFVYGLRGAGTAITDSTTVNLPATVSSYNITGLDPDGAWRASIYAIDGDGDVSAVSVRDFTTDAVIVVPVGNVVTLSTADSAAAANLAALQAAASTNDAITVRVTGTVTSTTEGPVRKAPLSDEWVVAHRCRSVSMDTDSFGVRSGLEAIADNTAVLCRIGTADQYVAAGSVTQGGTTFTSAATYNVGDCVVVMSKDFAHVSGKSKRGYMRFITAKNGSTYTVDKAWPRPMSTSVVAARHNLAPTLTITGGRFSQRRPENAFFTAILNFSAARRPVVRGAEITSGGYSGVYLYNCYDWLIENCRIHDLLDDDVFAENQIVQTQGAVREDGTKLPARKGISQAEGHFGYGVDVICATRKGVCRGGEIWWCRHAFTSNGSSGNHKINSTMSKDYGSSGEPEEIEFSTNVRDCTSANISAHEQGIDYWYHDFTSTNPGRYRHDYPSRTNKLQENPDHFNVRSHSARIENITCRKTAGKSTAQSYGITLQDVVAGFTVKANVKNVVIEDCDKGFDNRGDLDLDGVTVRRCSTGIHQQANDLSGGNVVFESTGTAFLVGAGSASAVVGPVKYTSVGTKVSGSATVTEGAATGGSGNI